MYSYYCGSCEVYWPSRFQTGCPVCAGRTKPAMSAPSENWSHVLSEYVISKAEPYTFPTVRATLRREGKQYLLHSHDVNDSGIHNRLQPESVIRILDGDAELFVEVIGYSYQGRVYHVRPFQVYWPVDSKGRAYVPKKWVKKK